MFKKFAIFFPQFHSISINNSAWGFGFTDWSLVAVANAFNYWRRRAPRDGFYDLSDDDAIRSQFKSAADYGLNGFAIYHYRFSDGPELNSVENFLLKAEPIKDFTFFLIWANENWSKRWSGEDTKLLKTLSDNPSRDEIKCHVHYLSSLFSLSSYFKVNSRPLFVIYRPDFFKNLEEVLKLYREEFILLGLNPLIGFFLKNTSESKYSHLFDFCYLFEPRLYQNMLGIRKFKLIHSVFKRLLNNFHYSFVEFISSVVNKLIPKKISNSNFDNFLEYFISHSRQELASTLNCPVQNVLTVGWNNAPRYRENHTEIIQVPNLSQALKMMDLASTSILFSPDIPMLCNAWNEWSEGAAIEPCHYLGDYLITTYVDIGCVFDTE